MNYQMNRTKLLLMCLVVLLPVALAQTPRSITVSATGSISGKPDEASFDAGVSALNADVKLATAKVSERVSSLTQAFRAAGVAEKDIRTSNFSVYPEQIYQKNKLVGTRYRVSNLVSVTVRDTARLGELLTQSTELGANEVYNVSYDFSRAARARLERQAREQAMASAYDKAEQLASLGKAELGAVQRITEGRTPGGNDPRRYDEAAFAGGMMSGGGTPVPVSSGQLAVMVSVQVVFGLK